MGIHTFFRKLTNLERLYRFPGEFVFERHNVASHSFKVAQYVQFLGEIESRNGVEIDWKALYEKAINHDVPEVLTGDIKTPVKYWSKKLKNMITLMEESMMENFIEEEFPEEFKVMYKEKLKDVKDDSIEGKILTVADKLDQLYEAYEEIQRGNNGDTFIEVYKQSLLQIKEIELHCVDYFFENILPEMIEEKSNASVDIKKITEEILNETL